jgi:hypothetical protein
MKLKINFILKAGITGETPIIAIINFGYKEFDVHSQKFVYKPLKYYTGIKVAPTEWDTVMKLPKEKSKKGDLLQIEKTINEVFQFMTQKGEVTNDKIKAELDTRIKGKTSEIVTRVRIVDFINTEILTTTTLAKKTRDRYSTLANKIEKFEGLLGKPLYSNDFNEQIYVLFMAEARKTLNKQNSIWSVFRDLRATIRRIVKKYDLVLFVPTQEISANDKVRSRVEDKVYLNIENIQQIIDFKPENDRMKNTKLVLLTLIFTGCRYSDVYKVKSEYNYTKDGISFNYTRFVTKKTDAEVIIPILKPLQDALDANGGVLNYKCSESVFNENVKELIRLCGLKENVTLSYTDAHGKKRFETKPFYQFVSSHTGRRSFITNLINHIPVTILTKITSHELKDNSIIFGYNKISLLENAALFVKELMRIQKTDKEYFKFRMV